MDYPKLRAVDLRTTRQNGERCYLLRDLLGISGRMLLVPAPLGPALMLCDGSHSLAEIEAHLAEHFRLKLPADALPRLVAALDEALLLDNGRFQEARARALLDYREAPFRLPALAGQAYPADPAELAALLDRLLDEAGAVTPRPEARGLLSPHIDFPRGGGVYARAWKSVSPAVESADLVVLIGTDHYAERDVSLTLTRQNYATPFGALPTDVDAVDALAQALGPEAAFAGELRHRGEHSLELVAVWLHHLRRGRPVPVIPILTGPFCRLVERGAQPLTEASLAALVDALRTVTAGRRVLWVASGDMAHVGPAFRGKPVDAAAQAAIKASDAAAIARLCAGDADGFYAAIQRIGDQNNVCGLAPAFLTLKAMGAAEGECLAYQVCPADEQHTSVVTVCGVVWE